MFKPILALVLMAATTSQAGAATAIICKYPTGETVVYQGAESVDITRPMDSGYGGEFQEKQIPLFINGKGPVNHLVNVTSTRSALILTYKSAGEFHINDVTIQYVLPYQGSGKSEYVSGAHQTDYSAIQLACVVKR